MSNSSADSVFCSFESQMQYSTLSTPHIDDTLEAASCLSDADAHPVSLPAGGLIPSYNTLWNCTNQPHSYITPNYTLNGSPNIASYRAKLLVRQNYFSSGLYRHIQPTASLRWPNNWNVNFANYSYQHLQCAIQPEMKTTTQSSNNCTNQLDQNIPSFLDNFHERNLPTSHAAPAQNSTPNQHVDSTGDQIPNVRVSPPSPTPPSPSPPHHKSVTRRLSRPRVNKQGKALLERSYAQKKLFAYPTHEQCEELGRQCGLTVRQVKKWFANKRSRDDNTRSRTEVALGRRVHATSGLAANVTDTLLGHPLGNPS